MRFERIPISRGKSEKKEKNPQGNMYNMVVPYASFPCMQQQNQTSQSSS